MNNEWKVRIFWGAIIMVALVFLYIWPGVWRYQYRTETGGFGGPRTFVIDRLTHSETSL